MTANKESTGDKVICATIFLGAISYIFLFYLKTYESIYIEAPDSHLYWSVSDNFFQTGHFVQSYYKETPDFIVPFGLPLILAVLKVFINSPYFVVAVQYILFGLTEILLYKTAKSLFSSSLAGVGASLVYLYGIKNNLVCGPSYILTETYTLFVIVLACYLVASHEMNIEKRVLSVNVTLFVGFVIRPALSILLYICLVSGVFILLYNKCSLKRYTIMIGSFVLVLLINMVNNYRETGEWVFLENYSAYSVYVANNPNTKTYPWGSDLYPQFLDDYGLSIATASDLSLEQKDRLFTQATRKFVKGNLPFVIKNAIIKYSEMFIKHFDRLFWLMWIGVLGGVICSKRRICCFILVVAFLLLTILTSFGLNVDRYAIVALPFYAIFSISLWGMIIEACWNKVINNLRRIIRKEEDL